MQARKSVEDKRDTSVKVMLTQREKALLRAAAEKAGYDITLSQYVRQILFGDTRRALAG